MLDKYSEQICEMLFKNFKLEGKYISLFLPIERHFEINTYCIWEKAKNFDVFVAVPKTNFQTMELKHILFENENQLELNQFGIPEPKKGRIVAADKLEYVFVPLYAADIGGHRVGYGKGFYDRLLKKCSPSCQFIGLSMFDLEPIIDDVLPTDIKLHACIMPDKIVRF